MFEYEKYKRHGIALSDTCRLEHWFFTEDHNYVQLTYTSRSGAYDIADVETDIELSREDAIDIVKFLIKAYNITEEDANEH